MFNWRTLTNVNYIYDGTFEGLLTIVFNCYTNKCIPNKIISNSDYNENFLETFEFIKTDFEKSKRIYEGIKNNISFNALYNCFSAFLSSNANKDINILKFLILGFQVGPKIDNMLSVPYVFEVNALRKNVHMEAHRLKGLLRFIEFSNNYFYASIHPENNVLELLAKHFISRFKNQNFIIHDKNRNKALVYNTIEYSIITDFELPSDIQKTKKEIQFENLWKTFFETIAIKERKNSKLQMQYMPKKYWQDLIENIC